MIAYALDSFNRNLRQSSGGGFFIEELRRGSVGTMPFCTQPEAFVDIWDRMRAGDEAGARETFDRYLQPVARIAAHGTGLFYAAHALACKEEGYRHYKIHPYYFWDPVSAETVPGRPSHVEKDTSICRRSRAWATGSTGTTSKTIASDD